MVFVGAVSSWLARCTVLYLAPYTYRGPMVKARHVGTLYMVYSPTGMCSGVVIAEPELVSLILQSVYDLDIEEGIDAC